MEEKGYKRKPTAISARTNIFQWPWSMQQNPDFVNNDEIKAWYWR